MKIINELAYCTIKNNKKDTLAIKISILLAVVVLGTVVLIIHSLRLDKYKEIISVTGDYHVAISEVDEKMYDLLMENDKIKQISFDYFIETDKDAVIIEKYKEYWQMQEFKLTAGRIPSSSNELIVPARFLRRNNLFELGTKISVNNRDYIIVGEYDDYGYSFEDAVLFGYLEDETKEYLFKNKSKIQAYLWYKSPRDTYVLTKQVMNDLKIDYFDAENTGRLFFNKELLEYKMVYPSGIIVPKKVLAETWENYGGCLLLVVLFAVMIYGAFNVWNSRDIKEFALLKSVGMTEKQIKKMVRFKVLHLSMLPIATGTIISYFVSNIFLYLVWLNNAFTYNKLSNIFEEKMQAPDFHFIPLSIFPVIIIILLSFCTVYLSAILPAMKSAKLKIIEGLSGISENKISYGKSKIKGKIETSLAKDYFRSYLSTYKIVILAMSISALVVTVVLVSQSYRILLTKYNNYISSYNFTTHIYTDSKLDDKLTEEIKAVQDIDEMHVFSYRDFKIFLNDNINFISEELSSVFKDGKKYEDNLYVRLYGLDDKDFANILKQNNLSIDSTYVLLNSTPDNGSTPYAFRKYIPITDMQSHELSLRYNAQSKIMKINLDGYIESFPYDLNAHEKNGIYVFTSMSNWEAFIEKNKEEADNVNYYMIQIKAKKNIETVFEECEQIISSYISKSDHSTSTDLLRAALDKEQMRNENILNAGTQIILLMIALVNAYNSFHGNLRSRKREFQLLSTIGMTEKQIKKMILQESKILFKITSLIYILILALVITIRAYKSNFDFMFAIKEMVIHLNYIPIILIFVVMIIGVLLAIYSGINSVLKEDLNNIIKEI